MIGTLLSIRRRRRRRREYDHLSVVPIMCVLIIYVNIFVMVFAQYSNVPARTVEYKERKNDTYFYL